MSFKILYHPVLCLACGFLFSSVLVRGASEEEKSEPAVERQLFSTTTLIETWIPGGRGKTGTGFVVEEQVDDKTSYFFLITCEHVLRGMSNLRATFNQDLLGAPQFGTKVILEIAEVPNRTFWNPDPTVDVALIPIASDMERLRQRGTPIFFRSIRHSTTPTEKEVRAVQEVLFVGHPKGFIDKKNLTPVVRRGTMASLPDLDFEGAPVFLIDAAIFGGSSGSPVFTYEDGAISDGKNVTFGTRLRFVGMISQAYFYEENGEPRFTANPAANNNPADHKLLNIGAVVKQRVIFDTLELFYRAKKAPLPKRFQPQPAPAENRPAEDDVPLKEEKPNKAPEPTPGSVTPRATEGVSK